MRGAAGLPGQPFRQTREVQGAEDEILVRRAQAGYPEAFEALVVRHRDRVYRLALRLTASPADAEDVAQEALVAAWQALPGFRGDSSVPSWLYRIVVNKARDAQRRHRPTPVDAQGDGTVAATLPSPPDPGQVVEDEQQVAALRGAVARLPFDLRAPLVLHLFEHLSYEETAQVLGLSEPTVRGRLARGRRELVQQMRGWS